MSGRILLVLVFLLLRIQTWAQKDTVVVNFDSGILNGKLIRDYTNTWKVTYVDAQGKETPNKIWTDYGQVIKLDGKSYFHRVQDLYDPNMNLQDTWINMVEHESLIPVSFSTLNPKGGFLYYQFEGNKIRGSTNQVKEGEVTEIDIELEEQVYDWNLYGMLLVGLPMQKGFVAKIPFYAQQSGGLNWMTVSVIDTEALTLPDGENIQTWKVATDQRLTFWLSRDAPYVIKLELQLQNNSKLVWETI